MKTSTKIRNTLENSRGARIMAVTGLFGLLLTIISLTPTPDLFQQEANILTTETGIYQHQPNERPAAPKLTN